MESRAMTVPRLLAWLRHWLHQHGWLAWGGLALLLGAAATQWLLVDAINDHTAQVQREVQALRQQQDHKASPEEDRARQQSALYAALPPGDSALATLALVHRAAHDSQVHLSAAEYHVDHPPGTALERYQMSFPVHADYPALRQWLSVALNRVPNLALDDISFKRDEASTTQLDSRVRMTLCVKAP